MPSKLLKGSKFGFLGILWFLKLLWKHKIITLTFIVLLPAIISSIQIARETQNPGYPFFVFGSSLITADNVLQNDVRLLEENPDLLIGMAKPDKGIWLNTKYYWKFFFNVIWKILGGVWLIFFPLIIIFRIVKLRQTSEPAKNLTRSIWIFLLFLFVVNIVIIVHGLIRGNVFVTIPEGLDTFKEYWLIFIGLLPFHGLFALFKYLITLLIVS